MTTYVVQMSLNIKQFAICIECNIDTICVWKATKNNNNNKILNVQLNPTFD